MKYKVFLFLLISFVFGCEFPLMTENYLSLYESIQPSAMARDGHYLYRSIRHSFTTNTFVNRKIERIDMTNWTSTVVAGNSGTTKIDGVGTAASFSTISDMVIHEGSPSMLYIAEGCFIRRMDTSTLQVSTVVGSGCGTVTPGTGTSAILPTISSLAIDGNDLYGSSGSMIVKIDLTTLAMTIIAGNSSSGLVDAVGTAARFSGINAMTVVNDTLYIIDGLNLMIRSMDLLSKEVKTLIGNGLEGNVDGTTNASFSINSIQNKITSDGENFLYITDLTCVRKIDIIKQEVTTILNPSLTPDDVDGNLSEARTFYPSGILYTPDEGLLISNFYGVRRIY